MPTVRMSSVRTNSRCPPTSADRTVGRPLRTTEMSVLVPPTSRKIPSEIFTNANAAATPAAGPLSIVRIGRRRICAMSMMPPSLRITINGQAMPLSRTACSVRSAVSSIRGSMLALITAVRVRTLSP